MLYVTWTFLAAALYLFVDIAVSAHIVLYKRNTRAAIAWVGIVWLTPFLIGAAMYILFGINRIQRRAQNLRGRNHGAIEVTDPSCTTIPDDFPRLAEEQEHMNALATLVGNVTGRPLLSGNRVTPLCNGDETYPAMLEAIAKAEHSITLSTYIFDNDPAGGQFVDALSNAVARGVEVRVLIDAVGARYSWPSIVNKLRGLRVPVATFLPVLVPWLFHYSNLRNHRKLLVVDGREGFTGGINIRQRHYCKVSAERAVPDLHFHLTGPVVAQIQEVFAADWEYSTNEALKGDIWFPDLRGDGPICARGISDGPDRDLDALRLTLEGAIGCARSSVLIVTPYFLPNDMLIGALNTAALRGVDVDIILPQQSNLALVQWASTAQLWQILIRGCRVWTTPPPFDHSKLMLIDGIWSLIGSVNWDPRSLRLNFEFNVECYNRDLAQKLGEFAEDRKQRATQVTLEDVEGRPFAKKLLHGVARLFSPYL
jgi:cardiolipin synthase